MERLGVDEIDQLVRSALAEDVGSGDVTTLATVPLEASAEAVMAAREPMVLAGLDLAMQTFLQLSAELELERGAQEGEAVDAGGVLLSVKGGARAILTAERVALNFVQRLSGIATLTAQFVSAIQQTSANILDTRKTTPGWRRLEKYAVRCGGGHNHRFGLFDQVLIKDNHLAALRNEFANPVEAAVRRARDEFPQLKVEVEADTIEQVEQAVAAGADIILLDNMSLDELRESVRKIAGRATTEASGGITLANVAAVAQTGVDFISVGALTHSARAVDIGLDFQIEKP